MRKYLRSETITVIIKKTKVKQNKQKWDCLYLYQLPGAHTENLRNSHPKHVNETHIQLRQAG